MSDHCINPHCNRGRHSGRCDGESVEQAALRRAAEDWPGRARREAAAILDELGEQTAFVAAYRRDTLIGILAIAWLQGNIYGSHETLSRAEVAFENLRAAL